jgi:hypothetical protein
VILDRFCVDQATDGSTVIPLDDFRHTTRSLSVTSTKHRVGGSTAAAELADRPTSSATSTSVRAVGEFVVPVDAGDLRVPA